MTFSALIIARLCMMRHRRQGNTDGLTDDGIFVVILRSAARGGALALRVTSDGGLVFVVMADVMKSLRKVR